MPIRLFPFTRLDFDRLISWIQSEEEMILWSGPFFVFPLDENQLEHYFLSAEKIPPIRCIFKAVDLDNQAVIGHIELNNIDRRNQAATVSKVLVDPQRRGQGYCKSMLRCLLQIAFDEMRLHRIDLRVFDFNTPAIRAYQRIGFLIEGHLRDYRKVGDQFWSSYLMSILENEWKDSRFPSE